MGMQIQGTADTGVHTIWYWYTMFHCIILKVAHGMVWVQRE